MNRYSNIDRTFTDEGTRYYRNPIYPEIPPTENDIYAIVAAGDRYDTLALQFYNDSSLWWVIAIANVDRRDSLIPTPGQQIRIPADSTQAVELYEQLNRTR